MKEGKLKTIKLIAVDLDGPLLVDTFSPIMYELCTDYYKIAYTRDIERNTFSRPRAEVVTYMRDLVKASMSAEESAKSEQESLDGYFRYRAEYMKNHPFGMKPEVPAFLDLLASLDVRLVCYGGLPEAYMRESLGAFADRFDPYVCTNDFRPGIREIIEDIYHVEPRQALFIDDVNFVAERARTLGVPFIGVPSTSAWSWQKHDMQETGVKYLVESVAEIDLAMLLALDRDATRGDVWASQRQDQELHEM
ncbi:hypothetical protein PO883_32270 [Massilia sp. DJPM01]|uniref:HAD family hydrolase n=1 Tax=Massilia sp. DJPM01 TaxID=3024404 RepID=UPI00259E71E1|nr:hypothetical protein [Massilia sp. DJPM01]MDM5181855.1 hypothetical protein [Massilia sp. DJPM01]